MTLNFSMNLIYHETAKNADVGPFPALQDGRQSFTQIQSRSGQIKISDNAPSAEPKFIEIWLTL